MPFVVPNVRTGIRIGEPGAGEAEPITPHVVTIKKLFDRYIPLDTPWEEYIIEQWIDNHACLLDTDSPAFCLYHVEFETKAVYMTFCIPPTPTLKRWELIVKTCRETLSMFPEAADWPMLTYPGEFETDADAKAVLDLVERRQKTLRDFGVVERDMDGRWRERIKMSDMAGATNVL